MLGRKIAKDLWVSFNIVQLGDTERDAWGNLESGSAVTAVVTFRAQFANWQTRSVPWGQQSKDRAAATHTAVTRPQFVSAGAERSKVPSSLLSR